MTPPLYGIIKDNILNHGRHLMAVFPTHDDPGEPFCYTIGNHRKGLPELLLIGDCSSAIGHILNNLSEQMIARGCAFDNNEMVRPFLDNPSLAALRVIKASPVVKELYTVQAGRAMDTEDYTVMQVVCPGTNGKFPGEDGADSTWGQVPVYPLM
jgi:hypothetical protein